MSAQRENMAIRKLDFISIEATVQKSSELEKLSSVKAVPAEIKFGVGSTKDGFEANAQANLAISQILPQLSKVEVEIKELMNEIQNKRENEEQTKDFIEAQKDQEDANLQKTADAYQQLLDATDLDP
jgi:hypothetical protein